MADKEENEELADAKARCVVVGLGSTTVGIALLFGIAWALVVLGILVMMWIVWLQD